MLTKPSMLALTPLVEAITENNLSITPRANTPISLLYAAINSELLVKMVNGDNKVTTYQELIDGAPGVVEGTLEPTQYKLAFDDIATHLSQQLVKHISVAKNVVLPIYVEFQEKLTERLNTLKPTTAASIVEVKRFSVPAFLLKGDVAKGIKENNLPLPKRLLRHDEKAKEAIIQTLLTADETADGSILAWASMLEPGLLEKWWSMYFAGNTQYDEYWDVNKLDYLPLVDKTNVFSFIYLVGCKLSEELDPTASGLNHTEYHSTASLYRDFAAGRLNRQKAVITDAEKTGVVLLNSQRSQEKFTVTVFAENYDNWIEKGNDPTTLFGAVVNGQRFSVTEEVLATNKLNYDNAWKAYSAFHDSKEQSQFLSRAKDIIKITFNDSLSEPSQMERDYKLNLQKVNGSWDGNIQRYLKEDLDKLRESDLYNVGYLALRLIAATRFYYTDSYPILKAAEDAMAANPNLTANEAALISAIKYTARYVAKQYTVKR